MTPWGPLGLGSAASYGVMFLGFLENMFSGVRSDFSNCLVHFYLYLCLFGNVHTPTAIFWCVHHT